MSKHRFGEDEGDQHDPRPAQERAGSDRGVGAGLLLLRVGLPATLVVAGLILLLLGVTLIGIVLVGAGVIAVVVDFFARMTNESEFDRDREEQARRTFMSTGSWPRRRR